MKQARKYAWEDRDNKSIIIYDSQAAKQTFFQPEKTDDATVVATTLFGAIPLARISYLRRRDAFAALSDGLISHILL